METAAETLTAETICLKSLQSSAADQDTEPRSLVSLQSCRQMEQRLACVTVRVKHRDVPGAFCHQQRAKSFCHCYWQCHLCWYFFFFPLSDFYFIIIKNEGGY